MGGNAFDQEQFPTPRMKPAVFHHVLADVEQRLSKFYRLVDHPITAPGKLDHGDIDVLCCGPLESTQSVPESLQKILSAVATKVNRGSNTINLVVPWPNEMKYVAPTCLDTTPSDRHTANDGSDATRNFVQVDIHICQNEKDFKWILFHQAHGDIWHMLGYMIRSFGLTCNDSGLYIRIEEIEEELDNREASKVLLTDEPDEVLRFLHLEPAEYWQQFTSPQRLMAYVATCRFHNPQLYRDSEPVLKSSENQRKRKRPQLRAWFEEYIPEHQNDLPRPHAGYSRFDVVMSAKIDFPDFGRRYDEHKERVVRQIREDRFWTTVRKSLDRQDVNKGYKLKGLKREIAESNPGDSSQELQTIRSLYEQGDFDQILAWIQRNANMDRILERQLVVEKAQFAVYKKEQEQEQERRQKLKSKADAMHEPDAKSQDATHEG